MGLVGYLTLNLSNDLVDFLSVLSLSDTKMVYSRLMDAEDNSLTGPCEFLGQYCCENPRFAAVKQDRDAGGLKYSNFEARCWLGWS